MKKALLLTSVASMIQQFNMRNIELLLEMGYEVEVACNFEQGNTCAEEQIDALERELESKGVAWHQIDFARNVFQLGQNLRAYKQLNILFRQNGYTLVHCQSPIGGVLGRIVAYKHKTKIIYTAHGFHFFKGAPWKNWLLFYPIEKMLSYKTDELLVINREDYALANNKFYMRKLTYIPGIGVNTLLRDCDEKQKRKKRQELGIPEDGFLMLQVAEFSQNKNQKTVIEAVEKMGNPDFYYVMCGIGPEKDRLETYVKKHDLRKNVCFIGFRNDVHELLQCADCFCLSSYREGLSVALMEAMAAGLPVIASRIRGNVDLIDDKKGGYLVSPGNPAEFKEACQKLFSEKQENPKRMNSMGEYNQEKIKQFSAETVDRIMRKVYERQ